MIDKHAKEEIMADSKVYDERMRAELKTGDVVLFSGKGGISAGIKWATLSRWSHVGMIKKAIFWP
jgi:hypothetical protein